jgi:DNA polymerase-3 subunit alpha
MVSYLTYITTVNPIEYNLPFERFLNPERPSAPDIDMDIADDRRDEMIEYAKKRYGADKVAQVGTFGTMMARGSVRDVARALGHPYSLGDQIAKLIPLGSQGFPMTIEHAFEIVPELKKLYDSDEAVKEIIDTAKKIEGCARHVSVHAAGVVIAPAPLTDFTPLQYDPKGEGKIITQYDMYSIEEAGLLKFDFLGIKNLSILADAVHRVEVIENKKIDLDNIPIDDKKTYEMLARGETTGVFQLGGDGMTKYLKDLRPTRVDDISVMVALYRPGPMDNIDEYIARKHGQKPVKYLHPKMKNFLDRTFGVLVYQDDLLMTALVLAGYSWGEVDKFRKADG